MSVQRPKVKVFADGAKLDEMQALAKTGWVSGFTTNPSLIAKAGVKDYLEFARAAAAALSDYPISLEVIADNQDEMGRQAHLLRGLGNNVYVKIPVTNTQGESCGPLIRSLSSDGIKLNLTALMYTKQVVELLPYVSPNTPTVFSLFAGRVADCGTDPMPTMIACREILTGASAKFELLWASCREVWNIFEADRIGCDIITAPTDVIGKLKNLGRTPEELSLEAVKLFHQDAKASGLHF
jgi:transaldolase